MSALATAQVAEAFSVEKFVDLDQWLDARRRYGIGASEGAIVAGEYGSRLKLYCDKLGIGEPDDLSSVEAVEWGLLLEPVVADKYARATGRQLTDPGRLTICRSLLYPWAFATLDRVHLDTDVRRVVEVKTTGATHEEEWESSVPRRHWIQVQHQLAVTGYEAGAICVLIGGQKFRHMDVERNQAFIDWLMAEERKFWALVQAEHPPEADGSFSAREALARMYPTDDGTSVDLPGEANAWDSRLTQLKAEIKGLQAEQFEIENRLKAAIGAASFGVLPNGSGRYSHKSQTRAEYVCPESTFRVLRRTK